MAFSYCRQIHILPDTHWLTLWTKDTRRIGAW